MSIKYLNKEDCLSLLKYVNCPEWVIDHSKRVAQKSLLISKNFNVNLKLVISGALLHDIGRSKSNGVDHAVIGAEILSEWGIDQETIKIVERHVGAGITDHEASKLSIPQKNYLPLTIEEKIVAHADNLINGSQEVDIDFVIQKWESKLGSGHESVLRLKNLHRELIVMPKFRY